MPTYAEHTKVSAEKSRAEIERTLVRYGATGFMYGWEGSNAMLAFAMADRRVKFVVPLPQDYDFQLKAKYEQAVRQRWRAMALVIKSKLEAVESGIVTFENEFLAHIMLPDGTTVGDVVRPRIEQAYLTGDMPALLPGPQG